MKINEAQLNLALNEFIDREIMPLGAQLTNTEQFVFGIKIGVIKRKIQGVMGNFIRTNNAAKMLEIIDENGYIDVDCIYQSASDTMSQIKQLDVAGITFREGDLQKLYGIIQRYAS